MSILFICKHFIIKNWLGQKKSPLTKVRAICFLDNLTVFKQEGEMNMSKSKTTPMTPSAAARIQGGQAKANGGQVAKGSFAAKAQAAAAKNSK
jgi:hypothetical protein